jgi:hypothetical protein
VRPIIVAGAAAALVAAVVVGVVLTSGGDEFPSKAEQALLASVPAGYRDSCVRADAEPDGAEAHIRCEPTKDAESLTLTSFATRGGANRAFDQALKDSPVDSGTGGDCYEAHQATHRFANSRGSDGKVLCFRRGGEESTVVWTDPTKPVLGRALRNDDDDTRLYGWWVAFVHRPEADITYPLADEQALLDELPDDVATTCRRAGLPAEEYTAWLRCEPPGGPSTVEYTQYKDLAALNAYYEKVRAGHAVAVDAGVNDGCPAEGAYVYTSTNAEGGRRVCYFEGATTHLTWTETETLVLIEALRSDADYASMYGWAHSGAGQP